MFLKIRKKAVGDRHVFSCYHLILFGKEKKEKLSLAHAVVRLYTFFNCVLIYYSVIYRVIFMLLYSNYAYCAFILDHVYYSNTYTTTTVTTVFIIQIFENE